MRKLTITIGDNGDLVRGYGHLGPIAGDQPLAEAVKCDRAVFSEALRSLTLQVVAPHIPFSRLSETMTRYLHRFRRFARATAPGGAPERQERSLSRPRPVRVMRVSSNTFQSVSVLRWELLSKPTHVREKMATHGPSLGSSGASADRLSSSKVRRRNRPLLSSINCRRPVCPS